MPGTRPGMTNERPRTNAMTQAAAQGASVATPQSEKMLSRREGSVGYVIFNKPERHNAVSLDMWQAAGEMLDDYRNDNNIKVVVVTGNGGKAFVSGADISRFEKERSSEDSVAHYNVVVEKSYAAFHEFPKPTIAMIRGYCIGGGMGLATCCDLRIATEGSKVAVLGPSYAMEIFYTARQFTAAEALGMGLVNRVVPDGELESYVMNYAETI